MKTREPAIGTKVDEMEPKFFYPLNCLKAYKKSFYEGHLLASENKTLIEFKKETPISWWNNPTPILPCVYCVKQETHQSILPQRNVGSLELLDWSVFVTFRIRIQLQYITFNPTLLGCFYYWTKKQKRYLQSGGGNVFF
jgi:hypothetical protein